MNLSTMWAVAAAEMRLDRRLVRTWVFIVITAFFGIVIIGQSFAAYSFTSAVSSSGLLNSPLMLPFQLFPSLFTFLWLGVIFLAFDIRSRDKRERLDEVVGTLPVTNLELVIGRAMGITVLMLFPVFVITILYYIVGVILEIALPNSSFKAPETYITLASLLIDSVPNILFWVAIVMFITMLVRFRVIAAVIALGLIGLLSWAQNSLPIYVLNVINSMTVGQYLPSEVAPTFTDTTILTQRLGMLLVSVGFLFGTAWLYPRLDAHNKPRMLIAGVVFLVAGSASFVVTNMIFTSQYYDREALAAAHAPYAKRDVIDIESISGLVALDPGDDTSINLDVRFKVRESLGADDVLRFSLNPGYDIERLELNGESVDYSFNHGLLVIETNRSVDAGQSLALKLVAIGEVDQNFAYLDSAVDLLSAEILDAFGLIFQGTFASINSRHYVALLPDLAWYPMPGAHVNRDLKHQRARDFFTMDLSVSMPDDWHVAGPGKSAIDSREDVRVATLAPHKPLHEIALFASEFERRVTEIEGIEFELLVTPGNIRNVDLFAPVLDDLKEEIGEKIIRANSLGFHYPYQAFTIVETPLNLRAYRGGWRMDSAQTFPGIFALREGSFLQADFSLRFENLEENTEMSDEEKSETRLAYVTNFFKNDIYGGNVILAAWNNVMQYQTDASGEGAIPLGYLMNYLAKNLIDDAQGFYSAHVSMAVSAPQLSGIATGQVLQSDNKRTLNDVFFDWNINQPNVWDDLLAKPLGQTAYEDTDASESNLHVLHLWGRAMGQLMRDWVGDEQLAALLVEIRTRYEGENYTFDDVMTVAADMGVDLTEVFSGWLSSNDLPGYRVSPVSIVRLPDLEYGMSRYEASFYVENGEPVPGLIAVQYSITDNIDDDEELPRTRPIKIPGNSSIEVAIITEEPLEVMLVEPYLSYNRATFTMDVPRRRQYDSVEREEKPLVQMANWQYDDGASVVVDDLDHGFSVDAQDESTGGPPWFMRFFTFAFGEAPLDQGLASYGSGPVTLAFGEWSRQQMDPAYGKYRRTLVRAFSGSSSANLHFAATLPHNGRWKLEYYLPRADAISGFAGAFSPNPSIRVQFGERSRRQKWGNFNIWVADGDKTIPVDFDGESMNEGWNTLGEFDLSNTSPTVSLSTLLEQTGGINVVVADAIRWTPAT